MKKNKTNLNAIDSRIYKYWQALYLAFYSSRLYIDVGKRWRGFGLTYFLLVIAIAAIPLSVKSVMLFNDYYNNQIIEPIKKIPNFTVTQGRLVFPGFTPYLISNNKNEVAIIIDEKTNLTEINYLYPQWMIFITSDRMYIRLPKLSFIPGKLQPELATSSIKDTEMKLFEGIPYAVFNGEFWGDNTDMTSTKRSLMIVIYPTITFLLYGFFAVFLWFMTILGKAFSYSMFKFKIGFKCAYRLMLVSSGSAISLFIMSLSFGRFPLMGLYLFIVIVMYFFFAVLSLKRESKSMVLA